MLLTYLVKETGIKCRDCGARLCLWTVAAGWLTRMVFCIKILWKTGERLCEKRNLGVGS